MIACGAVTDLGVVRDVLTVVDCNTRNFAQAGYQSLATANSPFQTALTAALTIYVALAGYRLLFGHGMRLSDGPMMALKIGAVLALVTSWSLFQTLVFDLAERAPVQIAAVISKPLNERSLAADPVAGLQAAYDRLSEAATALAHPPKDATNKPPSNEAATAAQALNVAADGLFVTSAGLVAVLTIAIGLLTATGPLFVALFLFTQTRGFFVGWVRALGACAFGLLSTWSLSVLMLHSAQPWLEALLEAGGTEDAHTALTTAVIVLVFSAAQIGLLLAAILIARGFGLSGRLPAAATPASAQPAPSPAWEMISRPARLAEQLARTDLRQDTSLLLARRISVTQAAHGRDLGTAATSPVRIGDLYRRPATVREGRRG
jgi:type IV secretion system protein VirB6